MEPPTEKKRPGPRKGTGGRPRTCPEARMRLDVKIPTSTEECLARGRMIHGTYQDAVLAALHATYPPTP